ncbi:MAG: DUF2730 family protein [Deltaproteobacteria bacterium]|nr:DUF2730 family protein [Deltaproteobacteria bacterium]
MNYASMQFWLGIAQWAFNIIVALYLWINRKHQATMKRIESASDQVSKNEKDIIRLKAELKNLPSQAQFSDLSKEIRSLTKELSETKGRLQGINRAVDLINEHLINKGN